MSQATVMARAESTLATPSCTTTFEHAGGAIDLTRLPEQTPARMTGGMLRALAVLLAVLSALACRAAPKEPRVRPKSTSGPLAATRPVDAALDARTDASADAANDTAPVLAPLHADAALVSLPVQGFRDAVVSVPIGATEQRPVVVALHGNFDRPEWQCDVMREITSGFAFILCPRGIARRDVSKSLDRWEYGSVKQLKQELDAGLSAVRERFAPYVADGPIVMTGFSLGAILARPIVMEDPARFSRVVFTEGGSDGWNFKRFNSGGGSRVIFGCAQAGCAPKCRGLAQRAERAGVEVRVADGGHIGHTYDGPVAAAIQAEWSWLVETDPNWKRPGTGPERMPR
jgi:dienelactone hydrolase